MAVFNKFNNKPVRLHQPRTDKRHKMKRKPTRNQLLDTVKGTVLAATAIGSVFGFVTLLIRPNHIPIGFGLGAIVGATIVLSQERYD